LAPTASTYAPSSFTSLMASELVSESSFFRSTFALWIVATLCAMAEALSLLPITSDHSLTFSRMASFVMAWCTWLFQALTWRLSSTRPSGRQSSFACLLVYTACAVRSGS
jgi:hypothetical protein